MTTEVQCLNSTHRIILYSFPSHYVPRVWVRRAPLGAIMLGPSSLQQVTLPTPGALKSRPGFSARGQQVREERVWGSGQEVFRARSERGGLPFWANKGQNKLQGTT